MRLQPSLRVVEVGLRDGLQSVTRPVATEDKVAIVERLIDAGVREIEVASFAHPRVLPQLADAEDVLAKVPRGDDVRYRVLVPNLRGAQRASACAFDVLVALVSCDDAVSRINQGRSTDEVLAQLPEMARIAADAGATFAVGLAMSFFAPAAGVTDPTRRAEVLARVVEAGATAVYFADTVGMADPRQVTAALESARAAHPDVELGLHLHARNGFALANVLASLQVGVDWLEAAFCGIGGDLWFPGSPEVLGNLPTEDLLLFAESLGVATGIDRAAYRAVSAQVVRATGVAAQDHVSRGGAPEELAAVSWQEILSNFTGVTTASGHTNSPSRR